MTANSFGSRATLEVAGTQYEIYRLDAAEGSGNLPYSLKILLENLLRNEDGANITADHVRALANWDPSKEPDTEIQFTPARVILQDLTGVPAVVDLAAMREAMKALGGDATKINPLIPAELVIDHSVVADVFGRPDAFTRNVEIEFHRNRERFGFLRWGQEAFSQFKVVPPGTGIVHQVNIEYLARVVMTRDDWGDRGGPPPGEEPPTPTPAWVPTRTPPCRTALACSAGASAASRPRLRCSASRCPCSSRRSSGSG